jgi:hypothetical protein
MYIKTYQRSKDRNAFNGLGYFDGFVVVSLSDPDGEGLVTVPIIAPELKIDSTKVEDLQLCYAIKVPDGMLRFRTFTLGSML